MSVRIIGLIRLKDKNAFDEYRGQVGATVERYKGIMVARGLVDKSYWNELACGRFDAYVELSFPSAQDADCWANSLEYQKLLPIRSLAMDLSLFRIQD